MKPTGGVVLIDVLLSATTGYTSFATRYLTKFIDFLSPSMSVRVFHSLLPICTPCAWMASNDVKGVEDAPVVAVFTPEDGAEEQVRNTPE